MSQLFVCGVLPPGLGCPPGAGRFTLPERLLLLRRDAGGGGGERVALVLAASVPRGMPSSRISVRAVAAAADFAVLFPCPHFVCCSISITALPLRPHLKRYSMH